MATTPNSLILPQTFSVAHAVVTAAKTTYNDGANAVLLVAGGANGSLVRKMSATARATVTASQLMLLDYDGTNYWLIPNSPLMPAYTMAATTNNGSQTDFGYSDANATSFNNGTLYLPNGHSLYVATAVALAAGIVFRAEYANL